MEAGDRRGLGSRGHSPSLPLPSAQPLPWVSGARGAANLAKGFPGRSEGPSPLQPSRFREIRASLKKDVTPALSPRVEGSKPRRGDTQRAGPCAAAALWAS